VKIVALVAVTALVLALAIGWIRPTGTAAVVLAFTFLVARIAVALFGTRRRDVPRREEQVDRLDQ
jgi:hypothetical protein